MKLGAFAATLSGVALFILVLTFLQPEQSKGAALSEKMQANEAVVVRVLNNHGALLEKLYRAQAALDARLRALESKAKNG